MFCLELIIFFLCKINWTLITLVLSLIVLSQQIDNLCWSFQILDGIVRLSKTYIKLILDGCVLFNCWKANFLCDDAREACVILDFGENSEQLKGNRRNHPLEEFINALANVFENCHTEWLKYLSDKRDQYLELNFFTISQLVFLQKELIKIGTDVEPSDLIFPLLSLIKPECSMSDIQQAMQKAKDEVFQMEETEEVASDMEDAPVEKEETEQHFIQELINAGYSEQLAQAAFIQLKDADVDAGWLMFYIFTKDSVKPLIFLYLHCNDIY